MLLLSQFCDFEVMGLFSPSFGAINTTKVSLSLKLERPGHPMLQGKGEQEDTALHPCQEVRASTRSESVTSEHSLLEKEHGY